MYKIAESSVGFPFTKTGHLTILAFFAKGFTSPLVLIVMVFSMLIGSQLQFAIVACSWEDIKRSLIFAMQGGRAQVTNVRVYVCVGYMPEIHSSFQIMRRVTTTNENEYKIANRLFVHHCSVRHGTDATPNAACQAQLYDRPNEE